MDDKVAPSHDVEILCSRLLLTHKAKDPDAYALVMHEILNACDCCKAEVLNTLATTLNGMGDTYEGGTWVRQVERRLFDLLMGSAAR